MTDDGYERAPDSWSDDIEGVEIPERVIRRIRETEWDEPPNFEEGIGVTRKYPFESLEAPKGVKMNFFREMPVGKETLQGLRAKVASAARQYSDRKAPEKEFKVVADLVEGCVKCWRVK